MTQADIWRKTQPVIHRGKGKMALTIEPGHLIPAHASSDGSYLFSELGNGAKALCITGTADQIRDLVAERGEVKVRHVIPSLGDSTIYAQGEVSTDKLVEGADLQHINPLSDAVASATKDAMLSFIPNVPVAADAVVSSIGAADMLKPGIVAKAIARAIRYVRRLKDIAAGRQIPDEDKTQVPLYVITVGYLQEPGMKSVGNGEVSLRDIVSSVLPELLARQ